MSQLTTKLKSISKPLNIYPQKKKKKKTFKHIEISQNLNINYKL